MAGEAWPDDPVKPDEDPPGPPAHQNPVAPAAQQHDIGMQPVAPCGGRHKAAATAGVLPLFVLLVLAIIVFRVLCRVAVDHWQIAQQRVAGKRCLGSGRQLRRLDRVQQAVVDLGMGGGDVGKVQKWGKDRLLLQHAAKDDRGSHTRMADGHVAGLARSGMIHRGNGTREILGAAVKPAEAQKVASGGVEIGQHGFASGIDDEGIGPQPAIKPVARPFAGLEPVTACPTQKPVRTHAAERAVIDAAAIEAVIAAAAIEAVISCIAVKHVMPGPAMDAVIASPAAQRVVALPTTQMIVPKCAQQAVPVGIGQHPDRIDARIFAIGNDADDFIIAGHDDCHALITDGDLRMRQHRGTADAVLDADAFGPDIRQGPDTRQVHLDHIVVGGKVIGRDEHHDLGIVGKDLNFRRPAAPRIHAAMIHKLHARQDFGHLPEQFALRGQPVDMCLSFMP